MSNKAFILPTIFTATDKFSDPVMKMQKKLKGFSDSAMNVAKKSALVGAAILAPLALAANEAIKFEDRMADVAKTTGMAGAELTGLGDEILRLSTSTRTPIEGLQKIAEIGGQLGIVGKGNIVAFTDSVNKFSVALGSDFQGGVEEATRAIGSLNVLFKETRNLDIADSITKAGSAINALSSKGVQVPELTEFTKRIGQLPDAIKPAIQETIALGAVFNKAGITAEIAARGLGDVLLTASQNAPVFAKQIGLSVEATKELLNTNPTEFLKKFAQSLQGVDAGQFAKISGALKLGDVGSIKVIGALSSSIEKLSEYQTISNVEFAKGTSLINEYNVKNETMAAKLAKAKNNFEAISITVGTELIPIIGDLLKEVMPVVKSFGEWAKNNKSTIKTVLKVAIGIAGLSFAVSGFSAAIAIVTTAIWLWNAALMANPIVWVIVGIAALIAIIILVISYWKEWGAAVVAIFAIFMPGIALIISLVMTFYNNWQMIVEAFKSKGILGGLMAIGSVLLDVILAPLQQILEVINKVTGFDWAASAAGGIEKFRESLDLNTGDSGSNQQPVNPQAEKQASMQETFKQVNNNVSLDINTQQGTSANVKSNSGGIPVKTFSTHAFGM